MLNSVTWAGRSMTLDWISPKDSFDLLKIKGACEESLDPEIGRATGIKTKATSTLPSFLVKVKVTSSSWVDFASTLSIFSLSRRTKAVSKTWFSVRFSTIALVLPSSLIKVITISWEVLAWASFISWLSVSASTISLSWESTVEVVLFFSILLRLSKRAKAKSTISITVSFLDTVSSSLSFSMTISWVFSLLRESFSTKSLFPELMILIWRVLSSLEKDKERGSSSPFISISTFSSFSKEGWREKSIIFSSWKDSKIEPSLFNFWASALFDGGPVLSSDSLNPSDPTRKRSSIIFFFPELLGKISSPLFINTKILSFPPFKSEVVFAEIVLSSLSRVISNIALSFSFFPAPKIFWKVSPESTRLASLPITITLSSFCMDFSSPSIICPTKISSPLPWVTIIFSSFLTTSSI